MNKIYDISQEVFSCKVYGGDPPPVRKRLITMDGGDIYNLTAFEMCAHNGTHIDAPYHFYNDGDTVDKIPLERTVGPCYVSECSGKISARDARQIIDTAMGVHPEAWRRILIKGGGVVTLDAAAIFAEAGVWLVGSETQSVGPEYAPMPVHLKLLGAGVVLLEGVRLGAVSAGTYMLYAAPILLGGADGAPCRALLTEL